MNKRPARRTGERAARQRRPTMNDVARVAGVGLKTVSRVVNDEGGVRPELTSRVRAAIAQLGYRHNAGASSLRRSNQSTATVGLVLEDVANPFSSLLQRSIEDISRSHNFVVLAGSSDEDPSREHELVDTFCTRRVDGLLLVPTGDAHAYLKIEMTNGMPVVLLDRPSAELPDVDTVLSDNAEGSRSGTTHLLAHGHTRIAYLGDDLSISTARERLDGFRAAVSHAGIRISDDLIRNNVAAIDTASNATRALLSGQHPPTAIFSGQNIVTIGVVRALRELGEQHRIAVVGFDDFLLADMLDPAVTVVAQDPLALGRRAAELLFRRINGEVSAPERVIIRTRLIARGSGEIRPAERPS